nr:immunoglobulin heavy chain junction region [Macaca mulatta]MOY22289.1 immunoglobulin heavy chain junction region [Macaca mulatta]MOY23521.1 immunoglobulin heavy chain junction region [Macaca mulatta]MOY23785.1 immunoglobulin heavy chain junction region [Macaca mulatta]MOY24198.1 immunoglobulin heavy chain junction region [Macaca mulatta]
CAKVTYGSSLYW